MKLRYGNGYLNEDSCTAHSGIPARSSPGAVGLLSVFHRPRSGRHCAALFQRPGSASADNRSRRHQHWWAGAVCGVPWRLTMDRRNGDPDRSPGNPATGGHDLDCRLRRRPRIPDRHCDAVGSCATFQTTTHPHPAAIGRPCADRCAFPAGHSGELPVADLTPRHLLSEAGTATRSLVVPGHIWCRSAGNRRM